MKPTDQQINEVGRKYFDLHKDSEFTSIVINDVPVCYSKYDKFIVANFMRNDILISLTIEI